MPNPVSPGRTAWVDQLSDFDKRIIALEQQTRSGIDKVLISELVMAATGVMDFQSIPQGYTHLELELLVDSTRVIAGNNTGMRIWFNNDRSAHYDINGHNNIAGASPVNTDVTNINDTWGYLGQMPANGIVAGTPHAEAHVFLPFYSRTDTSAKIARTKMMCGITAGGSFFDGATLWASSAGINRVSVGDDINVGVRVGSRGRLYGIPR